LMLVVLPISLCRKAHRGRCLQAGRYSGTLCDGYLGLVHNCECGDWTGVEKNGIASPTLREEFQFSKNQDDDQ
jgi:hypothetical protein